jgi:hypothetical protein
VYDGDSASARDAWDHWTDIIKNLSVGVLSVAVSECYSEHLAVKADPMDLFLSHVVVDYTCHSRSQQKAIGQRLTATARDRGWQHGPV